MSCNDIPANNHCKVMNLRENRSVLSDKAFHDAYNHWQNNPKNLTWLWLGVYTIKYAGVSQKSALTKAVLKVSHQEPAFVPLRLALTSHFTEMTVPNLK